MDPSAGRFPGEGARENSVLPGAHTACSPRPPAQGVCPSHPLAQGGAAAGWLQSCWGLVWVPSAAPSPTARGVQWPRASPPLLRGPRGALSLDVLHGACRWLCVWVWVPTGSRVGGRGSLGGCGDPSWGGWRGGGGGGAGVLGAALSGRSPGFPRPKHIPLQALTFEDGGMAAPACYVPPPPPQATQQPGDPLSPSSLFATPHPTPSKQVCSRLNAP